MDKRAGWTVPVVEDDSDGAAAARAAGVLGWPGVVLPEVTVFGCRFLPVVVPKVAVHEARRRDGDGPQRDGDVLAMWEWPESPGPAPALLLSGGLFRMRRGFSGALSQAREWRPFGPAAVLAPTSVLADETCRWECALRGVGLVATEPAVHGGSGAGHVPADDGRRAPAQRRTADRWIEETLYALALEVGAFAEPSVP